MVDNKLLKSLYKGFGANSINTLLLKMEEVRNNYNKNKFYFIDINFNFRSLVFQAELSEDREIVPFLQECVGKSKKMAQYYHNKMNRIDTITADIKRTYYTSDISFARCC